MVASAAARGEAAWPLFLFRVLSSTSPTVLAPRPVWAPAAGSRAPIKGALPRGLSRRVKDGEKRIRRVRQLLLIGPGDYGDFRSAVPAKRQERPAEAAIDI